LTFERLRAILARNLSHTHLPHNSAAGPLESVLQLDPMLIQGFTLSPEPDWRDPLDVLLQIGAKRLPATLCPSLSPQHSGRPFPAANREDGSINQHAGGKFLSFAKKRKITQAVKDHSPHQLMST